ncbi:MAG: TusE/DsrC/DsvC family sulfur relay protein [Proteobacteria bacterium]|nr:TusE/DsrC/DsvC family sulfur relay protein [Pseudomonadota bacterium]
MGFELNGKTYETDEDGYLIDIAEWTEEVATYLADVEEIPELTEKHWQIINFLRNYYQEFQIAPMIKILIKEIMKLMELSKRDSSKMLYELYPAGPAKQACKIAGLPKPTGCV